MPLERKHVSMMYGQLTAPMAHNTRLAQHARARAFFTHESSGAPPRRPPVRATALNRWRRKKPRGRRSAAKARAERATKWILQGVCVYVCTKKMRKVRQTEHMQTKGEHKSSLAAEVRGGCIQKSDCGVSQTHARAGWLRGPWIGPKPAILPH